MDGTVAILALGAVTSVGLSPAETATSVRAGVCRFAATPYPGRYQDPLVMGALPDELLAPADPLVGSFPDISARQRRLLRLGGQALAHLAKDLAGKEPVTLFLAVPEHSAEDERTDNRDLLNLLSEQAGVKLNLPASKLFPMGRAGGIVALKEAVQTLAAGTRHHLLVGGVDTYRDRWLLQKLDREGRISSPVNSDGFIPGEGAAFLLLSTWRSAQHAGVPILGSIGGIATSFETGHLYSDQPYRGEGLASAFTSLFASQGDGEPVGAVYAGFNGESYPAKSWGVAYLRHSHRFRENIRFEHPADCIGDTGAAMAPLMVMLAVIGMRAGYRAAPSLVWCLSDYGHCGAILASATASSQERAQ